MLLEIPFYMNICSTYLDAENLLARGTIPFQGVNLMMHRVPKEDIFKDISPLLQTQVTVITNYNIMQSQEISYICYLLIFF